MISSRVVVAVFLVMQIVTGLKSSTPEAEIDCDENPQRLRFAQLREMEDTPLDITPFIDVPVDYETGRAIPMNPAPELEDPSSSPTPSISPSQSPSTSMVVSASTTPSNCPLGICTTVTPSPSTTPSQSTSISASSSSIPILGAPALDEAPLKIAPRPAGSEVIKKIEEIKKEEVETAIKVAHEAALAASPSPLPLPMMEEVDNEIVLADDIKPGVGLHFDRDVPVGDGKPELVEQKLEPQAPPEPILESLSPTRTPSRSPPPMSPSASPWPNPIEDEFVPCYDAPAIPQIHQLLATKDDIYAGDIRIHFQRGQVIPVPKLFRVGDVQPLPKLHEFEKMPLFNQEELLDSEKQFEPVPAVADKSMQNEGNYQTFALKESYEPVPGVSKLDVTLAGDDMGSFTPSLEELDRIRTSASKLAGEILRTVDSLHQESGEEEEFRANELAANTTWALMNDPEHLKHESVETAPVADEPERISPSVVIRPPIFPTQRNTSFSNLNNSTRLNATSVHLSTKAPNQLPLELAHTEREEGPRKLIPGLPQELPKIFHPVEDVKITVSDLSNEPLPIQNPRYEVTSSLKDVDYSRSDVMNPFASQDSENEVDELKVPEVPEASRDVYLGHIDVIRRYGIKTSDSHTAMPDHESPKILGEVSQNCEDGSDIENSPEFAEMKTQL